MKTYVTFGQDHVHTIGLHTIDKDCVVVFDTPSAQAGRDKAFEFFGPTFCFEYSEDHWDESKMMKYFPRGYIEL